MSTVESDNVQTNLRKSFNRNKDKRVYKLFGKYENCIGITSKYPYNIFADYKYTIYLKYIFFYLFIYLISTNGNRLEIKIYVNVKTNQERN